MGAQPDAVVDGDSKVKAVRGLRIVDASITPNAILAGPPPSTASYYRSA
jgi:choline dehydrogenase-like flavoprotein